MWRHAYAESSKPAVAKLVELHTLYLGPDSIVVVAETAFRDLPSDAVADAVKRLEARIGDSRGGRRRA
jgi:hypothetical protein